MADPLGLNELMTVGSTSFDNQPIDIGNLDGTSYRIEALGPNSFRVANSGIVTFNNTVGAGEIGSSIVITTFSAPIRKTTPELLATMYVGTDNDDTTIWPNGSALTSSPTTIPMFSLVHDFVRGDYNNGVYVHCFTVENRSGGSQTYYFHIQYLIPYGAS